jgi:selenide,water dikinase
VEIVASSVPFLPRAKELAAAGNIAGGSDANAKFVADRTTFDDSIDAATRTLLADAQTSGGLLLSMSRADAEKFVATFGAPSAIIGSFVEGSGRARVR